MAKEPSGVVSDASAEPNSGELEKEILSLFDEEVGPWERSVVVSSLVLFNGAALGWCDFRIVDLVTVYESGKGGTSRSCGPGCRYGPCNFDVKPSVATALAPITAKQTIAASGTMGMLVMVLSCNQG